MFTKGKMCEFNKPRKEEIIMNFIDEEINFDDCEDIPFEVNYWKVFKKKYMTVLIILSLILIK